MICMFQGCIGYEFNRATPANIASVAISPILNKTKEPTIERDMMSSIQSYIQFDGRLNLTSNENADALLKITLSEFNNDPISYKNNLEVTPHFYRQSIKATATLIDLSTGQIINETTNMGESVFEFQSDLSSSKRNTQKAATDELARLIFNDLIEVW